MNLNWTKYTHTLPDVLYRLPSEEFNNAIKYSILACTIIEVLRRLMAVTQKCQQSKMNVLVVFLCSYYCSLYPYR